MTNKQHQSIKESTNVFLAEQNIVLLKDEKILNVLRIKDSYLPGQDQSAIIIAISFTIGALTGFMISITIGIIMGLIALLIGFFIDNLSYQKVEPHIFGLITTKGIRTKLTPFLSWDKVYHIRKYRDQNFKYLIFDLVEHPKGTDSLTPSNYRTYQTPFFIFWAGEYEAIYNNFIPYWEPHDPRQKPLKPIRDFLSTTYQLEEYHRTEKQVTYLSKQDSFEVLCSFSKRMPFKQLNANITLDHPITAYLNIQPETRASKLKRSIGFDDILIGDRSLDEQFQFHGSHITELKELFTDEVIGVFRRLTKLGTVEWLFGKPVKQKRLQTPTSGIQDTEDVLDTSLLKTEDPKTDYKITDEKTYNKLEFNGILNPNFEEDVDKATEFVELSMKLSLLLAEGLKEMKK